jgi:hypothetical protein
MASACSYNNESSDNSTEESKFRLPVFRFHRRGSESSDESPRVRSRGFIRRFPREIDTVEAPTFDRIMSNPEAGAAGFIRLPELPDLRTLTGLGNIPGIKSSEDEDDCVVQTPTINFPRFFQNSPEPDNNEEEEEDRINRIKEVEDFGKNLQKQCIELYENESIPNEFEKHKIRGPITHFAKFAINDYSTESYHYIWAILLDIKGFFQHIGDEENADMVLKIMKMIKSKYSREDIPSGGAGGWDLYEYTPL